MTGRAHADPPIEIVAASSDQKPVLKNLLELYQHDFSEFIHLEIGGDGRYRYRDIDLYWTDPQRFPFLIFAGGKLAGLVLVRGITPGTGEAPTGGAPQWDIAEFFVLRGYRRSSVGTRAALDVFARFPGPWRVRVMQSNVPACAFWSRVVRLFAGDCVRLNHRSVDGRAWSVFSFHSPPLEFPAAGAARNPNPP